MIFNKSLKMDSAVESVPDEGEISTFATNGNWAGSQSTNNPSNSTLLFIAVEYVKDNASTDYKFETDSSFSPQPSTYSSEFDQHVSPLDPNMSSTARYSPVYSEEPVSVASSTSTGYSTPVVVPLMSTELDGAAPTPTDSCFQDIADADTQLLRQVVGSRYLQMVAAAEQIEAEGEENAGGVHIDYSQRSPEVDEQLMNKELQLVQFPMNSYQQQLSMVERNLKVDPDQVELLITDQNTGISYSYVSQDFLVSRTPLPSLPEDEQQLNNVLNTLESHGLVMETNDDGDITEVTAQNSGLTISDGQMMLQDPLLDSDLLLQAPVEIALDDNVLSASNTLVLKPELPASNQLLPPEILNTPQNVAQQTSQLMSNKFNVMNVKEEHLDFDEARVKAEFEAQHLRRSRRQNDRQSLDDDMYNFTLFTHYWMESIWEPPSCGYLSLAEQKVESFRKGKQQLHAVDKFKKTQDKVKLEELKLQQEEERAAAEREKMKARRVVEEEPLEPVVAGPILEPSYGPYGQWKTVEIKPKKVIDFNLPKQQEYVAISIPVDKPEPIKVFKEKTIASLAEDEESCSSIGFKKRKFPANKSRNVRKRFDND